MRRIHGWDVNGAAVRVAIFSLYVALLEEVDPPDIRALIKNRRVLPELWGETLVRSDFFDVREEPTSLFHVIVGNPPWTSRRGPDRASVRWCKANSLPMPGGEDAWAFVWKALRHLRPDGITAFLLPAMGFLHNQKSSFAGRKQLVCTSRIRRVIDFADLRFQLFEGAIRPAALIMFGANREPEVPYQFEYWTPKADLNLQLKRTITLSTADRTVLSSTSVQSEPLAFKHRLWMREPEAKLFSYLTKFPALGSLISEYRTLSRRRAGITGQWVIGVGYQPYNEPEEGPPEYSMSKFVGTIPDLPIEAFTPIAQTASGLRPWRSKRVRRKGFEAAFTGSRILIPRTTAQGRLRASYTEADLTFQDIILGITVPQIDHARGKLLTAFLNSRIAAWFAFHGTASFGSERPEVKSSELLRLTINGPDKREEYSEDREIRVDDVLSKIMEHIHRPLAGNFQLMPDLRAFVGKNLYLVKPMQRRFWLRSSALSDADAIAADLQHAIDIETRRSIA